MNRTKYNISELFGLAFGTSAINVSKTILTRLATGGDILNRYNLEGVTVVDDEGIEVGRKSYLDTDIVYPLTLEGGLYNKYTPTGEVEEVKLESFEMPAVTLSTFRRAKNISETRRLAGSGTVKEMYGFDDWQIDIQGLCLPDPSHPTSVTAWEQHLRIAEFEGLSDSIGVVSKLYNARGVNNIVIREITFGQIAGKPGVIPFLIRAMSDKPKDLE